VRWTEWAARKETNGKQETGGKAADKSVNICFHKFFKIPIKHRDFLFSCLVLKKVDYKVNKHGTAKD
jgi:hypothetical protein